MIPPPGDPSAPVQTWKQEEAFASARACEAAHTEGMSNLLRLQEAQERSFLKHKPPAAMRKSHEDFKRTVENYRQGRCVPAEHIYPPATTPPKK